MGRGAGKSGGSRAGGFSKGGGRGFSSHRSSGGSRGSIGSGSFSGRNSQKSNTSSSPRQTRSTPPPRQTRPTSPPPTMTRSIFTSPPPLRHRSIFTTPPPMRTQTVIFSSYNGETQNIIESTGEHREYKARSNGMLKTFVLLICLAFVCLVLSIGFKTSTAQTISVERLADGICISTDTVIDDELGWINDKKTVEEGINYFYEKTGVQPYLYICDNMNGKGWDITDEEAETYLANMYDSLFKDEGHMIFAFMEYAESEYITYIYTGTAADGVIDADAREIFLNAADRYYMDSSLSDEEYFNAIFINTADDIMYSNDVYMSISKAFTSFAIVLFVIAFILYCCVIWGQIKDKELEEAEKIKEILDIPLSSEDELKDKYN